MQKLKHIFRDKSVKRVTTSDIQHCLRLKDLDEIGDGSHFLDFYMLGLYSFKHWSLNQGVQFWLDFLSSINCLPDTVTIHPDCQHHRYVYDSIDVEIKEDINNIWSDGDIGGYCTEFYKNGIEIGNIVVPLGESLDCGFGLERINFFMDGNDHTKPNHQDVLNQTIEVLINSGIKPSNTKQGYVLRKLIRRCIKNKISLPDINLINNEYKLMNDQIKNLPSILKKHPNREPSFYWETFGIDVNEI